MSSVLLLLEIIIIQCNGMHIGLITEGPGRWKGRGKFSSLLLGTWWE